MKLPKLDYARPATLAEAVALLATSGGAARPIAGGQTLMPLLAFRLASPSLLVDLAAIPGLGNIQVTPDGVHLGAMVRWADIEAHAGLAVAHPLLAEAVTHVAHWPIRQRGTVGGSLAHADPAAELPGIVAVCDGVISCTGPQGTRQVKAAEFFLGALTTALAPEELIVGLALSEFPAARRWAFAEFARRRGDFALAGVMVFWDTNAEGRIDDPHVGVIGAHRRPMRIAAAEEKLQGQRPDEAVFADACSVFADALDPPDDLHGTAEYRRALAANLLGRALRQAAARAR